MFYFMFIDTVEATDLQDTPTSFLYERKAQLLHLDRNLEQIIKTLKTRDAPINAQQRSITQKKNASYLRLSFCLFPIAPCVRGEVSALAYRD
jgi:hypothetical protein